MPYPCQLASTGLMSLLVRPVTTAPSAQKHKLPALPAHTATQPTALMSPTAGIAPPARTVTSREQRLLPPAVPVISAQKAPSRCQLALPAPTTTIQAVVCTIPATAPSAPPDPTAPNTAKQSHPPTSPTPATSPPAPPTHATGARAQAMKQPIST